MKIIPNLIRKVLTFKKVSSDVAVIPKTVNIKPMLRKGIGLKADTYERMNTAMQGRVMGNLPLDMLSVVVSRSKNKGEKIKEIQQAFFKTSEILKKYNPLESEAYLLRQNVWAKDEVIARQCLYELMTLRAVHCFPFDESLYNKAGKILKKSFKDIAPNLSKVEINEVGSGYHGNVFKISFLDKNGEDIFKSVAMKVFKTAEESADNYLARFDFAREFVSKHTQYDLIDLLRSAYPRASSSDIYNGAAYLKNNFSCFDSNAIKEEFIEAFKKVSSKNGVVPEANIMEYIRFFTGRKITSKDDLVLPYMFGFGKSPFCLSEYVSWESDFPKRKMSLMNINLKHTDVTANPSNLIKGKIIDIGGIIPFSEVFGVDKITIKYLKKFIHAGQEGKTLLVKLLNNKAFAKNLIYREKIEKAYSLARSVSQQIESVK